ncbi:MAG: pyruvate kinase [Ignisphaera sp.]|nr:pyruvate kinase [Ignisphaera sp.]MCX8167507.1 pyruvate kinase [Ignisphaera sp.]MDW8084630.1 pyruvate kinase [Ignisphaera sp.]
MLVKTIVSVGPSSGDERTIDDMIKIGVNGFRINFSHGSPEEWKRYVEFIRNSESRYGRFVALVGDLQGPSLRIGIIKTPVNIKKNDIVKIFLGRESEGGSQFIVPMPIPRFFEYIDVGDILVMDDGRTRLRVVDKGSNSVDAVALTNSIITSRKAITIHGKEVDLPPISENDIANVKFAIENGFDYLGLSYARTAEDVALLRDILRRFGNDDIGIITKIETRSAISNLDAIIRESDAVLVARGDLGMNFGLEEIHLLQKRIIERCLEYRKPVIVATQLLESMTEKPIPTRAEVVDVSIAVEAGVDALMLTGETSVGKYPLDAVLWLKKIIEFVERNALTGNFNKIATKARMNPDVVQLKFVKGVLELAEDINGKLIVFSMHGSTARRVSSLRPTIPIYVGSHNIKTLRKLSILWGLHLSYIESQNYEEGLRKTLAKAIEQGFVSYGDYVVLTYGLREPVQRVEIRRIAA